MFKKPSLCVSVETMDEYMRDQQTVCGKPQPFYFLFSILWLLMYHIKQMCDHNIFLLTEQIPSSDKALELANHLI